MDACVYIMAGGSGTRLAPLSLNLEGKLPKQFLSIVGKNTMLQETMLRIPENVKIAVIPEIKYESVVLEQAKNIGKEVTCLSEPFGCNTASAILLGALKALADGHSDDTVLFFMPADHIMNTSNFRNIFSNAIKLADKSDKIVTIGISPSRPETGYGYIEVDNNSKSNNFLKVIKFVEKPDLETANMYFESDSFYWNAGIFAFKVKVIMDAMKRDAPQIYNELMTIKDDLSLENITSVYTKIKEAKSNISIDYAVMEKEASNILLIPAKNELKWNDVGSWNAIEEYLKEDDNGNKYFEHDKNLIINNCSFNDILNYSNIDIEINDTNEIIIVATVNGILICGNDEVQRAKDIIGGIESGESVEQFDCINVIVENSSKIYIGVIGLEGVTINFDGKIMKIFRHQI